MKKGIVKDLLLVLVALLPVLYVAFQWSGIPDTIAVHYNAQGKPDRYGSKSELWLIAAMFTGAALLMYFLLTNLHKIDPKRVNAAKSDTFDKLAVGLLLFITALGSLIVVASTREETRLIENAMLPLMGLMFAFLGNYMYSVKPNYFAGIRTPWALSDDENWRKTHRLGGTLWFFGGLVVAVATLLLSAQTGLMVMIAVVVPMVLVPFVYSFILFTRSKGSTNKRTLS